MTILLGYYWHLSRTNNEIDKLKSEAFHIRHAYQRIVYALSRASLNGAAISPKKGEKPVVCFYTTEEPYDYMDGQSLVFTFDNGPDIKPEFSNGVLARLYCDRERRLRLLVWPILYDDEDPLLIPPREETLLENVADLRFEMYCGDTKESRSLSLQPPEIKEGREDILPLGGHWYTTYDDEKSDFFGWQRKFGTLPVLIRVVIEMEGGDVYTFATPLPLAKTYVVY